MRKIMTHIVAGYPSLEESRSLMRTMAKAGADFIEIQIPFSDPLADGPTIMAANQKALENGTRVEDAFNLMRNANVDTPLLFMTYYNIIFKYGVQKFCQRAAESGCYGLIVPDMPIDEEKYENFYRISSECGLKVIQVVSPLTPEARLKRIAEYAEGFVYCVARYGTTGAREEFEADLAEYLGRVRKHIDLPLAVGFGISKPEHFEMVWEHAEIAVIGSAILKLLEKEGVEGVGNFIGALLRTENNHS